MGAPKVSHDTANVTSGRKTVAAFGTAERLVAAFTECEWVVVTALETNTGYVAVGGSTTLAAAGSQAGILLSAGQSASIPVASVHLVYVDSRVNGEGVSFVYGVTG